jgi:hypothetical protein
MTDELGGHELARTPATRGRRFKPHAVELTDGGRLILGVDGSIDHIDDHGSKEHRWKPDDPEWPDQAIRFGLHPQVPTITPQGRYVQGTKPPRR